MFTGRSVDNEVRPRVLDARLDGLERDIDGVIGGRGEHLGFHVDFYGNIAYDEHVHDAICQRVSFLDRYPHTRAANDLRELGKQISNSHGEQLLFDYL